ncbi:MAG: LON peptidase substrate-binding domain-containing protein [Ignavibacteriae bacterium]|nr:LON peptidase substrate-binding domain-containing protein [Ignavibacteriota bacterium]
MTLNKFAVFPLKIVLFPESIIPLHIFEDKYKKMVNNFVENQLTFGINLSMTGKNFDVGCEAGRIEIIKRYDDDRLDILVYGGRRYLIHNLIESEYGYFTGTPDFFEDDSNLYDGIILMKCLKTYNDIVHLLNNETIKEINLTDFKTSKPSFYLAQKTGLTAIQKQHILELKSENDRLNNILNHLQNVLPAIRESELVSRIIKNDGYMINK